MKTEFKTRSSADPLLATRLGPEKRKRFDFKVLAVAVFFAVGAFWLGSWWIRTIIDAN